MKCEINRIKLSSFLGFSTGRFHVCCVALRLEPCSGKDVVERKAERFIFIIMKPEIYIQNNKEFSPWYFTR